MTYPRPFTVIFDLDGTLVDTSDDLVGSINYLRNTLGLESLPKEEAMKAVGQGFDHLVRTSLENRFCDEISISRAKTVFSEHYINHIADNSLPYEGIISTLECLKDLQISLCIATNKENIMTKILLDSLGMTHYFDLIISGGMGFPLKPDPAMIKEIAIKKNTDTNRIVLIGDAWTDITSAKNAGCISILACWGFNDTRGEAADFSASSPLEVVKIVSGLIKNPE